MRFSTAAVASGLAAVAVAESNGTWSEGSGHPMGPPGHGGSWGSSVSDSWVTEVVTAYTTYCPEATAITHAGSTYSVTSATTLTITNCPGGCTISKPVSSAVPVTSASSVAPSSSAASAIVATTSASKSSSMVKPSLASVGSTAPYKPSNGTAVTTAKPTGTGAKPSSIVPMSSATSVAPYKGDASKASFGVAGLLAAVGLVAAL